MTDSIRNLLRSNNPKDRIQGIQESVRNPNANTARLLATIASKDPEASVRSYAKQAAQQLTDTPERVPEDTLQEANYFLDEANTAMFEDDIKEARTFARRAFQLAPQLRDDDIARDVAVYVMKMPADDAIDLLLSDRDLFEVDKTFRKQIYGYSDENWLTLKMKYFKKWNVTWQDIGIDIPIYMLVITLPIIILMTLSANLLASSYLGTLIRFRSIFIVALYLFGLFAFQMVLTHLSANWALGGDGSFRRLIHHELIPVTAFSIFLCLMFLLARILYAMDMGLLVESGMIDVFNLIGFGVFVYNLSHTIGYAYQFDFGKGCLALMFPYIMFFCFVMTVIILRFGTEFRAAFTGT